MTFTKEKLKKLQKAYDKAVKKGDKIFIFEGTALLVNYAKYLLQYLNQAVRSPDPESKVEIPPLTNGK